MHPDFLSSQIRSLKQHILVLLKSTQSDVSSRCQVGIILMSIYLTSFECLERKKIGSKRHQIDDHGQVIAYLRLLGSGETNSNEPPLSSIFSISVTDSDPARGRGGLERDPGVCFTWPTAVR